MTYFANSPYASIEVERNADGSRSYYVIDHVHGTPLYDGNDEIRDFRSYNAAKVARYELSQHYNHLAKSSGF